jgi:hypothetical protein
MDSETCTLTCHDGGTASLNYPWPGVPFFILLYGF